MAVHPFFMALALALGITAGPTDGARAETVTVIPVVDVEAGEGTLNISARASAVTPATITAELSIERHGPSGNVSTRQSRQLDLKAGDSGDIARTSVSFDAGDTLEVQVTLRGEGRIIGRTSLEIGGEEAR